ncbi:3-oxoacyl-[acyl-carrier-protein] reductase FabG-like [Glandiceps talaboti]
MATDVTCEQLATRGRLQDTVAIVFGGTAGIGYGIVQVLQKEGATVVMTGRNKERGELAEKELSGSKFIQSDIRHYQSCEQVAKETHETFGKINIVVCNAGIFPVQDLKDLTEEHISEILDVNLKGTIFATKACLPYLKESAKQTPGGSRVIFTSSITGNYVGCPALSVYGATKAGQMGFLRTAAVELAADNITVNAVLPGSVKTDSLNEAFSLETDANEKAVLAAIPLKRYGTPEDMGNVVAFLASPEASFITGQGIACDGGQILPEV